MGAPCVSRVGVATVRPARVLPAAAWRSAWRMLATRSSRAIRSGTRPCSCSDIPGWYFLACGGLQPRGDRGLGATNRQNAIGLAAFLLAALARGQF